MVTTQTDLGIDLAGQDHNHPDWHAAHEGGARFAYLRIAYWSVADKMYLNEVDKARAAGLVTGAYYAPHWGPRADAAKTQIAACRRAAASVGGLLAGKDLPLAIDVEGGAKGFTSWGWSKAELVEFLRQLVLEVEDQLDHTPTIYTSYFQWYDLGLPAAPWAGKQPCFVKTAYRLSARQPVDQVTPAEPHIGLDGKDDPRNYHRIPDTWAHSGAFCQQWQGDAVGFPGFDRTVDMDRFFILQQGSKGPFVEWLQRRLSAWCPSGTGADPVAPLTSSGLAVDGDFGPKTDAAVRAFQRDKSLDCDGIVGLRTFVALAWATKST